jgi:hypothetical protein
MKARDGMLKIIKAWWYDLFVFQIDIQIKAEILTQGWPTTPATGATFEFTLWPRATGFGTPVVALYYR